MNDWNNDVDSLLLSKLASSCNNHLIADVLCPWGCSEFMHRCGYLDMDMIFQRYLPKCILKLMNEKDKYKYTESARDDYIRYGNDVDLILCNQDWKVLPSIYIKSGKPPLIMTCRDHNHGSQKYMVHPCRQPNHILPTARADQFCYATISSRTVKPVKKSLYSNTFQMQEQRGSFSGVDTCNITDYHNFNFTSKLSSEAEARSIQNRPDINALLTQLVKQKKLSRIGANCRREEAVDLCKDIDFDQYSSGSTYVPVEVAVYFQGHYIEKKSKQLLTQEKKDYQISLLLFSGHGQDIFFHARKHHLMALCFLRYQSFRIIL